jgi:hypothetical protein
VAVLLEERPPDMWERQRLRSAIFKKYATHLHGDYYQCGTLQMYTSPKAHDLKTQINISKVANGLP